MSPDDDIVEHTDILSSPSKAKEYLKTHSRLPGKQLSFTEVSTTKRRRYHGKKLFDVIIPPVAPVLPAVRKRGRPKKVKLEEDNKPSSDSKAKRAKLDVDLSISSNHILPRSSRKRRHNLSPVKIEDDNDLNDDDNDDLYKQDDIVSEDNIPKKKRGRPKKISTILKEEETSMLRSRSSSVSGNEPGTPRKGSSATTDHDFTSPLKKVILSNLAEYKNNVSYTDLKLTKDFVPTRLPTTYNEQYVRKFQDQKSNNTFLDTFEGYFDQKKFQKTKSKNSMAMAPTITREDFATITNLFNKRFQKSARSKLEEIQKQLFPQYWFELSQGFSLLFYGIGSKREFLENFAINYLSTKFRHSEVYQERLLNPSYQNPHRSGVPCIIVNGYNPTCNYRDIFKDISDILLPADLAKMDNKYWGNHCMLHIQKMAEHYKSQPPYTKLIIVVHNLDGPSVRKNGFQLMLSHLALIKQIAIIGSTDNIYAPLLWDNTKSQNYNFIFHNITNYQPNAVESSFQDVMKLGRDESSSGAEGAKYVLESLTSNAKKLYKLLIETQLGVMEVNSSNKKVAPTKRGTVTVGIDFKKFHDMCAADFIVSNEISLRTMLKEFIDHKMANLSKKPSGSEFVWVPYNYSEMKRLLSTVLSRIE